MEILQKILNIAFHITLDGRNYLFKTFCERKVNIKG